jgi:sigma-B regulation protein RsbU (phosphoserine phosphatase)
VRTSPAAILESINAILHERQLESYYCTLCYAHFDFKRRLVTLANSGLPYPIRASADGCGQLHSPGVPLGSFPAIIYDEMTADLKIGDVFVFFSDGISEAMNATSDEFGVGRLIGVIEQHRERPAQAIADGIFAAVYEFCGEAEQSDDRTVVAFDMEFGYWMPVNSTWQVYVAGGPALNLVSRDDKGDDEVGPGFTVGVGLRRRGGLFFEMKVGAFDSPDFKLAVGYTFK